MSTILAIETSCDDCAAAIVSVEGQVHANVVYTQNVEHERFGGVVPEVAARSHLEKIAWVVKKAFEEAQIFPEDIEYVAVTTHPGLVGSLLVGAMFAKGFAQSIGCQIIAVNHLEGHLLAGSNEKKFPKNRHVALIVSGGHSALYLVEESGYKLLGETLDDAAGEAFDKVGKMLGLGYPAGKKIDEIANGGDAKRFEFPRALKDKSTYDYSFSGLKTSVRYKLRDLQNSGVALDEVLKKDICASMRQAVVDALLRKAFLACKRLKVYSLVLGGGVAANSLLRFQAMAEGKKFGISVFVPKVEYCTDNAVMIGLSAIGKIKQGAFSELSSLGVSARA